MLDLILKKRAGGLLKQQEFDFIASGAADGSIPDYQLAAWLMAAFFNPLSNKETAAFTKAMAFSGKRMDLGNIRSIKVDKHSTGGVGDGISLALAPLVAAAGVAVPMMSGRGLGHTGGTLDKLEAIKGFRVRLSPGHVRRQMSAIGVCMLGQTQELAPADKKLYALRDATGTVESRPLIVASILSKKYAEGINALVMDVKFGSGAFMTNYADAKKLAQALVKTAGLLGIRCVALLTDMDQPLGRACGNANEMEQSIRVLRGENVAPDFTELMYELGSWMVYMGKKAKSPEAARRLLEKAVESGAATEKLRQMIKWQGGDPRFVDTPEYYLKKSKLVVEIKAPKPGYISMLDARKIGNACVLLGAGRSKMEDGIDYGAGVMLERKTGDPVKKGDIVARLYASDSKRLLDGKAAFMQAMAISKTKVKTPPLIREIIK
jgi:pyrimidine-nucleoside phosphorylase